MIKNLVIIILLAIAISSCGSKRSCSGTQNDTVMENTELNTAEYDAVKSTQEFAFDLYAKINTDKENLFYSPFSISAALAMTYAGAQEETMNQMSKALHFSPDQELFNTEFCKLMEKISRFEQAKDIQLLIANALWAEKEFSFLDDYIELTQEKFHAEIQLMDFKNDSEKSRLKINNWIEKKTNDKIKDLLKPGVVNTDTRLVLTNAIYFLGNWVTQFDEKLTEKSIFYKNDQSTTEVPFMNEFDEYFYYMENNFIKALELPYKGESVAMLILLPKQPGDMSKLESSLGVENYLSWINALGRRDISQVSVPKFKFTSEFSLGKVLSSLGMAVAFTDAADFSGMTGKKNLKIDQVLHKAFVEVNERGTEAAAATAVMMKETAMAPGEEEPITFIADHPFIFLIRDKETGSILFMGKIIDPGLQ